LLIYTTPYTAVLPADIDKLLDAARRKHIDAVEKPRPFGAPFSRALELIGDAGDILALQSLMNVLRHWPERLKRDRAVDLTIRLLTPRITIELTAPAVGSKQMAAVCSDIAETVWLLEEQRLIGHVTRILLTPETPYCDVRADIGDRPAYLIAPGNGEVWKAPGAGDVPEVNHIR
jgi:hypothetical protein